MQLVHALPISTACVEPSNSVAFSEYQHVPQNFAEATLPTLEQAATDPLNDMVGRLRRVVQSAKDFQNIQDAVLTEFSEMDSSEMVKVMQLAMTLAEFQGRAEVTDE